MESKSIAKKAMVIALYIVLVFAFSSLSYGDIQFRIAEILIVLTFYDKKYLLPIVIACAISNLLSPLGFIDLIFGTFASFLVALFFTKVKSKRYLPLIAASINGLIIGFELFFVLKLPFLLSFTTVFIGEFLVVLIARYLFDIMEKQSWFKKYVLDI